MAEAAAVSARSRGLSRKRRPCLLGLNLQLPLTVGPPHWGHCSAAIGEPREGRRAKKARP